MFYRNCPRTFRARFSNLSISLCGPLGSPICQEVAHDRAKKLSTFSQHRRLGDPIRGPKIVYKKLFSYVDFFLCGLFSYVVFSSPTLELAEGHHAWLFVGFCVFVIFRADLGLPGPRGGHSRTRLVPQYDVPKLSSESGLWEGISLPFFVF